MNPGNREHTIHRIFVWGVILKLLDGILELVGGTALLFTKQFAAVAEALIRHELIEDPHDIVATRLQDALPSFIAHSELFAAAYLLSHGIIKVALAAGLLRGRLWAYPSAVIVFSLFIVYQLYRYALTHSVVMIALSMLDVAVIWLTIHEYRYFKKHRAFPS